MKTTALNVMAAKLVSHQLTTARYIVFDRIEQARLLVAFRKQFHTRPLIRCARKEIAEALARC